MLLLPNYRVGVFQMIIGGEHTAIHVAWIRDGVSS